jgi:preprotein translocase subunit SecD
MKKNLRWRIILILAVVGLSIWAFVPPDQKVKLGLDLKGGVHLVLSVQTDDALRLETNLTAERLRESLDMDNIRYTKIEATSHTSFVVEGIQDAGAFQDKAIEAADAMFTRSPGAGGSYTFTMRPNIANQLADQAVTQAIETIERRVNELGVAEPIVARHGARDRILVQLPGVDNVQRAKDLISSTALLELRLVEGGPYPTREAALQSVGNSLPGDSEILPGRVDGEGVDGSGGTGFYVIKKTAVVAGNDLRSATASVDQYNRPAVDFTLKPDPAARFGNFTGANIGKPLGIVLDRRVVSAPTLRGRITDRGQITGITADERQDLVITLKSGALPASLSYLEERTVGATLGQDSVRAGVSASIGGLALVVLFMVFYYKLTGLNAVLSIVVNLLILLGLISYLRATMTLPGIAGFILTIGMGVDSNVLIFERIKEELAAGRTARAAVNAGFDRVWWTIVDTHVASLIAALLLLQFGTGPIRGFAVTLIIGLLSNVFTAVFVSRTAFELILARARQPQQALSI